MKFEPGDVVVLRSGGQAMTVAAVGDGEVDCIWTSADGQFCQETIPAVALLSARSFAEEDFGPDDEEEDAEGDDDAEEDEDDAEDEDEDEDDEEESDEAARRRRSA
jgi:uncharacterized protein YodC (DUF2158 family)